MKKLLFLLLFPISITANCQMYDDMVFHPQNGSLLIQMPERPITIVSISESHQGEKYILSVKVYDEEILKAVSTPDKVEYYLNGELTTKEIWDQKFTVIKTKYFTPIKKS
jgi:hypothetical protein